MDKFDRQTESEKISVEPKKTKNELDIDEIKYQNRSQTDNPVNKSIGKKVFKLKDIKIGSRKDIWYASIVAIILLSIAFFSTDGFRMLKFDNEPKRTLLSVDAYFQEQEIFPVYLIYLRNSKQGLLDLTITNPDIIDKNVEIQYGFTDFGEMQNQTVKIESGSVKKIPLTPYSSKLKFLESPKNATLLVKVTDEQNKVLYSNLWTVKVNPGDEIPWKIKNKDYPNLIASWVTPENRFVQELVRKAKDKNNGVFIPANKMNDEEFRNFVKDIFNTVKEEGITYNKSKISFDEGSSQRIRLPGQTLKTKSANSIDASILLASLFENVGLKPYIVILSEHAIIGVARSQHENDKIFIETSLLGRSTIQSILSFESAFTSATKSGKEAYNKAYSNSVNHAGGKLIVIDVHKARQDKVLPLN